MADMSPPTADMTSTACPLLRMVIVGEPKVGKTAVFRCLSNYGKASPVKNRAKDKRSNNGETMSHITHIRTTKIGDDDAVTSDLYIFDLIANELDPSIALNYWNECHFALLVYDVTNPDSCSHMSTWVNRLYRDRDCTNEGQLPRIFIVGNKCDVSEHQRKVSCFDGVELKAMLDAMFWTEISAKNGMNIDWLMEEIQRVIELGDYNPNLRRSIASLACSTDAVLAPKDGNVKRVKQCELEDEAKSTAKLADTDLDEVQTTNEEKENEALVKNKRVKIDCGRAQLTEKSDPATLHFLLNGKALSATEELPDTNLDEVQATTEAKGNEASAKCGRVPLAEKSDPLTFHLLCYDEEALRPEVDDVQTPNENTEEASAKNGHVKTECHERVPLAEKSDPLTFYLLCYDEAPSPSERLVDTKTDKAQTIEGQKEASTKRSMKKECNELKSTEKPIGLEADDMQKKIRRRRPQRCTEV